MLGEPVEAVAVEAVEKTEESKIDFAKENICSSDQIDFGGAVLADDGGGGRNILSLLLEKGERLKDDMVQSQIQDRPRYVIFIFLICTIMYYFNFDFRRFYNALK